MGYLYFLFFSHIYIPSVTAHRGLGTEEEDVLEGLGVVLEGLGVFVAKGSGSRGGRVGNRSGRGGRAGDGRCIAVSSRKCPPVQGCVGGNPAVAVGVVGRVAAEGLRLLVQGVVLRVAVGGRSPGLAAGVGGVGLAVGRAAGRVAGPSSSSSVDGGFCGCIAESSAVWCLV